VLKVERNHRAQGSTAPLPAEEFAEVPALFVADSLAKTLCVDLRLNGAACRTLSGIVQDRAEITDREEPLQ
jgi:hypothetical protein